MDILVEFEEQEYRKMALLTDIDAIRYEPNCTKFVSKYKNKTRSLIGVSDIYAIPNSIDFDIEFIHNIIDSEMEDFSYSYRYIKKDGRLYLIIQHIDSSGKCIYNSITIQSNISIEIAKDISKYISRFIK